MGAAGFRREFRWILAYAATVALATTRKTLHQDSSLVVTFGTGKQNRCFQAFLFPCGLFEGMVTRLFLAMEHFAA